MPTNNFKVGEMLNKRTRNSKTWINFDGSYTTEIHTGDVHFDDENGNLQNINTDLYDEADFDIVDYPVAREGSQRYKQAKEEAKQAKKRQMMNRNTHNFQALRVPFDCHIPRNFQRGYTIGKGQDKLTFKPVKASPSMGELAENNRSVITYQDVWNDTDVELKVLPNGIKETLWLKTDKAPTSFSFEVKGKDIAEDFTAGALKLMPAWLQDANGTKRDVEMVVSQQNDNKVYVELNADVTDLAYPIEIDPTVTIQPTNANDFIDATVFVTNPTLNRGDYDSLAIQYNLYETLIQFNLNGIPVGVDVINATLNLYGSSEYSTTNVPFDFYKIVSAWSESTVTYNTRPQIEVTPFLSISNGRSSANVWYVFDVKSVVRDWVLGLSANYGIYMKSPVSSGTNQYKSFVNTETPNASAANYPKLSVTYNQPPTAPIVTAPNGGETWNSLHTVSWEKSLDDTDPFLTTSLKDSAYSHSANAKFGQTYTVRNTGKLKEISIFGSNSSTADSLTLTIKDVVNGLPGSQIYASKVINNAGLSSSKDTFKLDTPLDVTQGQVLAFEFYHNNSATMLSWWCGNYNPYSGGNAFSGGVVRDWDMRVEVIEAASSSLQYNIQLSSDNGSTWKDIVGLTNAGVTSYDYDFINESESSTSKIRVRAFDGASYGAWDESDGVFTIQHNQAPTAPTNLSPNGIVKDRASIIRLSWQHNDANADPQAQFDLRWRKQGASTWNSVSQVTTSQYYDVPANTFPKGAIEWQVRTYDQAGLSSPYSALAVFNTGDKPAIPTITAPTNGATVPVANPTVQWSSVGQTAYHLKVLDINNALLWETIKTSTNKAQTVQYDMANSTDYKLAVAIKNADGLWSDFHTISIFVSYTPPAKPTVSIDKGQATVTLNITHPTPVSPEPTVTSVDIYRRKLGESTWKRIAVNLLTSYVDYTLASGETYEYKVRAHGDNGTFTDSDVVSTLIDFRGVWLFDTTDKSTLHQFKMDTARTDDWNANGALMRFAGRRLPLAEFDDTESHSVSVDLVLTKESGDLKAINSLIRSKNTLCYRDGRGRKLFCQVFSLPSTDEIYGNSVSITFDEVSYTEEV